LPTLKTLRQWSEAFAIKMMLLQLHLGRKIAQCKDGIYGWEVFKFQLAAAAEELHCLPEKTDDG
jgi:hypothetical protein